jgi:hypothetical protein
LGQRNEKAIGIKAVNIESVFPIYKQTLSDVLSRFIIQVAQPVKALIETRNLRQVIKDGIAFSTIANYQPNAPPTCVFENGGKEF